MFVSSLVLLASLGFHILLLATVARPPGWCKLRRGGGGVPERAAATEFGSSALSSLPSTILSRHGDSGKSGNHRGSDVVIEFTGRAYGLCEGNEVVAICAKHS